jgi:hypothetical protein
MKRLKLLAAALAAVSAVATFPALAVGNLADVRVLDRAAGRELPVYWHEGRAYVVGKPGNEYSVTVRNHAGEDLLAVMSVDGVNVLSGETASTRQGGYIVAPWDALDVKGWRKSLEQTAAFYFTSLGDSYAGRTGRPDNVGVIGVALFRRKAEPPRAWERPMPYAESRRDKAESAAPPVAQDSAPGALAKRSQAPSAPLGTGHGRREESHAQYTEFQRATSYPVETVTIHYDSYRNLVAMGVLQQPVARREPRAFPGFVPDPWR